MIAGPAGPEPEAGLESCASYGRTALLQRDLDAAHPRRLRRSAQRLVLRGQRQLAAKRQFQTVSVCFAAMDSCADAGRFPLVGVLPLCLRSGPEPDHGSGD